MSRKSYRVKFEGGSGFELAGIIDRPDTTAAVPVLVLSHCFTCNKDLKAIVRISRALAERGIAVLRYDMTGLGGSSGDFSQTNFSTNVADLKAAIAFADAEVGDVHALMGHSFGGAASLAVASEFSSDVNNKLCCVIALAAPSDTSHLASLLLRMNPAIEVDGEGEVSIGGIRWQIDSQMVADFRSHRLADLITNIRIPTLVMHSPVDETVGFDHALRIMSLINQSEASEADASAPSKSKPLCSLASLDGADHLLAQHAHDIEYVSDLAAAMVRRYCRP
ncbi:OsmC family protein [Rhodopirellula maiorica SM1]|uniref:OsmC family protein n=1 Tax=Rhodopirellula maiorica SM1 TaxID=1265738 RepID=M5RTY5_9BACT|nr:alpha/beta fold hydrolase [Rhodopirellula maiorica]EMI22783.1 OsmC family protein [Rhodopirellula maiorica SM1]